MSLVQFNGTPGTTWTNDTGKVKYQFIANLRNTCGVCLQYHLAIGNSWPIPMHFGCNCVQRLIPPGGESRPFVDFREVLADLPPDQKAAAVGAANWRLIESGRVKWADVVTEGRVRGLAEVVSLKRVTVKEMRGLGIGKLAAERAFAAGNAAAATLADEARRRLAEALRAKGIGREQAGRAVAERLASRLTIKEGPSGPQGTLVRLGPPPSLPPAPVAAVAAQVAKAGKTLDPIAVAKAEQRADNLVAAAKDPEYAQALKGTPNLIPYGKIEDRLGAYKVGDAKLKAVLDLDEKFEAEIRRLAEEKDAANRFIAKLLEDEAKLLEPFTRPSHLQLSPSLPDNVKEKLRVIRNRIAIKQEKIDEIKEARLAVAKQEREAVTKLLAAENPHDTLSWRSLNQSDASRFWLSPVRPDRADRFDEATRWLSSITEKAETRLDVFVAQGKDVRAYYSTRHGIIATDFEDEPHTIVHEFGHAMDARMLTGKRSALDSSMEFLRYRVGDEKPVKLKDIFPECDYKDHEYGRKDKFTEAFGLHHAYYVGKDYGSDGAEIISMGVEKLYEDPIGFAKADPEYFKFILGILDGSLR